MQERVHFKIHFMQLSSQLSWCTWWSIIGNTIVSVETLLYMLLVVAWSFCLHSQSWTSRTVGKWHPEKCLLGSHTGKLEHNWWMQVICEAALDVNRCEEDTAVVSFWFDSPWPTSLPYSAPVQAGCCFLSIYIRWLCSQKLETAT